MTLSPAELLAGGTVTHDVEIPASVLRPGDDSADTTGQVTVKPLSVKDVQLILKAGKDDEVLISALMIQQALAEPKVGLEDVQRMHSGLVQYLVDRINEISGLTVPSQCLAQTISAPLTKACFILAKEFGWTPQQVSELTIGQVMLYLEMLRDDKQEHGVEGAETRLTATP